MKGRGRVDVIRNSASGEIMKQANRGHGIHWPAAFGG
jgi:hypothetical protein